MKRINVSGVKSMLTQLIMGTGGDEFHPDNMDHVIRLSDAYIKMGGNTFDTAHQYEGSEEALGLWIEKRKIRDQIIIITKGCHPDDGSPGARVNARHLKEDLLESLERLRIPYVDMYALHRDDPTVPVGEIIEALNEAVRKRYVRAIGASNWSLDRIIEANQYAREHHLVGFSFTSPNFSLAKPLMPHWPGCVSADVRYCDWHEQFQIPLLAWSSQAGGFFSGKFSPDQLDHEEIVRTYYSDDNWERFRRAGILAERLGVSATQIALAFVLHQPFPVCALIGPENVEEMESSFKATQMNLSSSDLAWLDLKADK